MGIIKSLMIKGANKAADKIAKLSSLSPEQLEKVQKQREAYLSQKPDPTDTAAIELTTRLLASVGNEIFNTYLSQIKDLYTPIKNDINDENKKFNSNLNICYIKINKWVIDKEENSLEKLINVYEVLSNEDCNIGLIFHREHDKTDVYLSVTNNNNSDSKVDANIYMDRLITAIKGNFPGSEFFITNNSITENDKYKNFGELPFLNKDHNYSVASITNIPTEKSEKFKSQTIEKLLDGIIPSIDHRTDYTLILLATPVKDIEDRKLYLSEIYSGLAPYAGWQTNFTFTDSNSTNSMAIFGVNVGASAGIQNGTSNTMTQSQSTTDSVSNTETTSKSHSDGNAGILNWRSILAGKTKQDTVGTSVAKTVGRAITEGISNAIGITKNFSLGANFGVNFARASNVTATVGKSEAITQSFINHNIKHALEKLEVQMKRLDTSSALGFWDFAAYVISEDHIVANNVAHSYLALTQGEESFMSQAAINLWRGDIKNDIESEAAKEIFSYLSELRHPLFGMDPDIIKKNSDFNTYPTIVSATTGLSGKELSCSLNFPKKSILGLPVIECAEFGRNISRFDENEYKQETISLGNIFHMHKTEPVHFELDVNSLSSHTFITGSTGSGKSNTIYKMLEELVIKEDCEKDSKKIKFLVIEPAKGEYKNVFGNNDTVSVYGTNPKICELLKINPFSFPKQIHILEHIDRLIEIFNVCWPMYAAMPAVLKESIEKAYEDVGWNLTKSKNDYGENFYPTFADITRNVKIIIDSSEYDTENKGAYKGSLITRLKSLTNGINGQIFTNNEISNEDLFDKNVIVDLSRVGSLETKSLIMGLLVLKLQEYRLTSGLMNSELRHVTVIEEAHNLLKRTSTEQSQESRNLLGKSVEMLTNSIAEMRTYGEGFIIADQAPGLLDLAVIRNTNTKIILRLPDQSDRELVGKSANLNDKQIEELAKLPKGVAAVYQNEWIEPVLCKVSKADIKEEKYDYKPIEENIKTDTSKQRINIAKLLFSKNKIEKELYDKDLREIGLCASTEIAIRKILKNPSQKPRYTKLSPIIKELFPTIYESFKKVFAITSDVEKWTDSIDDSIKQFAKENIEIETIRDIRQCIITQYIYNELSNIKAYESWRAGGVK